MRLLYYYGKISQFNGGITDFLSVNFSGEYEFVHNGEYFFGGKDNKLQLTITTSSQFLPSNFWSKKGKVYNCTLFVGNNAAGKTTILQGIILNEISADIRMGNERLVVIQDDGKIHAIAFRRVVNGGNAESEIYYSVLAPSVDDNSMNDKQPIILKKVQKQLNLSDIFEVTRIAYFSNTFSENDLLNYISLPFEFFKEDGLRSSKCIKNYSTAAKVESLLTNGTNYDIKKQFQLFWNSRYKEEAVFALSDIARNSVGDDFKKNLPEMIYISKIDLIYELGDVWKSKTYEVEDVIYGVSNREGNSRDKKVAYLISASCILRLVKNVDTAIALELLTKYIKELRKQENMNRGYFEIISDLVYVLFTSVAYEKDAKSISLIYKGNYESLSSLISETINNTNSADNKTLLKKIQIAYDFGRFLSELDLSSKFSISFIPPEPTYARYSNVNWEARAKIEDFSDDNRKEFIELVEKYETTLQYSTKKPNRPYLSFSWGLSSGQENMLDMLASLYRLRSNSDENTIQTLQIVLDEADIGYHPEWQREWFYYFPQIVEDIFKDTEVKDIQFILATHSPLLLGDIPSRCAKYVQCSKEGKTTINERLYDEEGEVDTFGQNLYTILRNGFFLKKGAIGEIAVKKSEEIAEVFKLLREFGTVLEYEKCNSEESFNKLIELKKLNDEHTRILTDAPVRTKKMKYAIICVSDSFPITDTDAKGMISNGQIKIEYGSSLVYTETLINLYSGMIKNQLMKEYTEIVNYVERVNKNCRTTRISEIDEEIKRLTKIKEKLVSKND